MQAMPARSFVFLLLLQAFLGCDGGGGGGGPVLPATTSCTLTAIAQEQAYVDSGGAGAVQVVPDPTSDDFYAYVINGQRYVILPGWAGSVPPEVFDFFLYHEFGHHFAGHHARYGAQGCKVAEYEADAFATRVMHAKVGAGPIASVTSWFAANGNQGDQTHRSKSERILYIEEVLAAAQSLGAPCPEVPATDCPNSAQGWLWLANPAPEVVQVYANGQFLGFIGVGQKGIFLMPLGTFQIEAWGTFFNPLFGYTLYGVGNYPIQNGEVTSI
jgi:hypothetical protein